MVLFFKINLLPFSYSGAVFLVTTSFYFAGMEQVFWMYKKTIKNIRQYLKQG